MAAAKRVVEDLPLVPTTCTARKAACGDPSTVSRRRMRSRPKRMPKSSSDRRCSSARWSDHGTSACQLRELGLEGGELVALGLDDGLGGAGDEALVGELALSPGD